MKVLKIIEFVFPLVCYLIGLSLGYRSGYKEGRRNS